MPLCLRRFSASTRACVLTSAILGTGCRATPAPPPEPVVTALPISAQPAAPPAASAAASSARPAHWGYTGDEGPAHWAALSPAYAACGSGQAQSPIDIATKKDPLGSGSWKTKYGKTSLRIAHHEHVEDIVDNGHTIQVTVDEGSELTTAKQNYRLLQFHFHTPSENTLDGKHYPMEMHLVHRAQNGDFAVLAAFFEAGEENAQLAQLIRSFPAAKGATVHHEGVELDLRAHLPAEMVAHGFMGSFTTPPCTENVEWLVLGRPIPAGTAQLAAFAARLNDNNRPVQQLHDRTIRTARLAGETSD
jgi:carbonic anhydrase